MRTTFKPQAPFIGAFLFFGSFGLYLFTLAPTVTFWDSGELITGACSLGIPHQPGYPLFCTLGRLFSFVPAASAAYRLNLLSAFFSALSVWVVYRTILALSGDERKGGALAAFLIALTLGVSRIFWSQAVVTEVYALGGFFVSALLYAHVLAVSGGLAAGRYLALSGFVFGLGCVNHVSLVLYSPALLLSWAAAGRGMGLKGYAGGVFFVLLGLSLYIYLPLRSVAGPELNIGHPDRWPDFLWTVRWADYAAGARGLVRSGLRLAGGLELADWRIAAALVSLAAAAWLLIRKSPRLYLAPFVFLVVYVAVVSAQVLGSPRDIRFGLPPKFFIPALITAAVLAGGLARSITSSGSGAAGRLMRGMVIAVFAVAALVTAMRNHHPNDYSKNFMAFDYAANSLKSVGRRGVLLTWGDNGVFPLWYSRIVERYRDDTVLVHTPLLTYGWYLADVECWMGKDIEFGSPYFLGENVYRLYKAASPRRPFCYDYSSTGNLKLDEKMLTLYGLVYYEGPAPEGDPWEWYVFRGVDDPGVFKGEMEKNIIQIYRYQAKLSARFPAGLFERP